MQKRERILNIMTQAGIVAFLLYFFIKLCPLVVFDCDDWMYLYNYRLPIPIWKGWEPTRVMPETLMPIAGWLAARIIYPIYGDYVYSVTIVSAIIITVMITLMCLCLQRLLVVRYHLTIKSAIACEILFLVLFFLIFRNRGTSQCMFTAADLCCIYFYTMSGILNAIVVLVLMCYDDMTEMFLSWSRGRKVLFLFLLYFALFSNLFHSAITAIYAGVYLLFDLRKLYCHKKNFKQYVRENIFCLLILVGWGIVLLFEASGGRADVVGVDMSLDIALAVRQLAAIICALSKPFVILGLLLILAIIFYIHTGHLCKNKEMVQTFANMICNGILLTIFLLLLNAKCGYMSRIDASWGIWFYVITFIVVAIACIVRDIPQISKLMPGIIILSVLAAAYPDGKFSMSTREHTDYQTCVQLDQYVISSIVEADEKGLPEIIIRIPDHSDDLRSLTYNEQLGAEVAGCLYAHDIIANKLNVITILDADMNDP